MSSIQVETRDGRTAFHPGDEVEGTVRWRLDTPPRSLEVRLFWYTEGKGERDIGIVERLPFTDPAPEDHRPFRFRLPAGPYSFTGKVIHLLWALEAVAEPGDQTGRLEITVSPSGREIVLPAEPAGPTKAPAR
jgi:hypothetical protein